MPYKSDAQRRYFNANAGDEISESTVDEWNQASKGKKLPEEGQEERGQGRSSTSTGRSRWPTGTTPTEEQVRAEVKAKVKEAVTAWLKKSLPKVADKPDHYLGGWHEKTEGGTPVALHLDVSQRFATKDKDAALKAGRERNQLAVWHIEKGHEIDTGGTGR
jgi:hypothetical protein